MHSFAYGREEALSKGRWRLLLLVITWAGATVLSMYETVTRAPTFHMFDYIAGGAALLSIAGLLVWLRAAETEAATTAATTATRRLILPIYFRIMYGSLAAQSVAAVAVILAMEDDMWIISVTTVLDSAVVFTVMFLLMRHGLGVEAVRRSTLAGCAAAVLLGLARGAQVVLCPAGPVGLQPNTDSNDDDNSAAMENNTARDGLFTSLGQCSTRGYLFTVGLNSCLCAFFGFAACAPLGRGRRCGLTRRPAACAFAAFFLGYWACDAAAASVAQASTSDTQVRLANSLRAALRMTCAVWMPLVIYDAVRRDSEYWQGLYMAGPRHNLAEPLLDAWDAFGRETADCLARCIGDIEQDRVPLIHFGHLRLDQATRKLGSGGSARVYRGLVGDMPVAVKMLFCLKLTPSTIAEFCDEARKHYELRHPNVVQCLGACVMPPALCLVSELCAHGSLFETLARAGGPVVPSPRSSRATSDGGSDSEGSGSAAGSSPSTVRKSHRDTQSSSSTTTRPTVAGRASSRRSRASSVSSRPSLRESVAVPPPPRLSATRRMAMALDAICAVEYLHGQGLTHNDIKSCNFLVDSDLTVKLADLGAAMRAAEGPAPGAGGRASSASSVPGEDESAGPRSMRDTAGGGLFFGRVLGGASGSAPGEVSMLPLCSRASAPEILRCSVAFGGAFARAAEIPLRGGPSDGGPARGYSKAADVYSLALVVREILTGVEAYTEGPLGDVGLQELARRVIDHDARPSLDGVPPPFDELIRQAWATDPAARPTAADMHAAVRAWHPAGHPMFDIGRVSEQSAGVTGVGGAPGGGAGGFDSRT